MIWARDCSENQTRSTCRKPALTLEANGTAFRVRKGDADVRVLSPVDGEVVETGGAGIAAGI
jgi:hypothetical protein